MRYKLLVNIVTAISAK